MQSGNSQQDPSLEEQVALLKQQLAQAQKLTALGDLVSTTTHEYNNVLMTILNYAKMGMRHRDDATRDKAFEKILAAGQRASRITNSILGLARNRGDNMEPIDLRVLVDDALVLLEREMNKYRVMVETRFDDVPRVTVNVNQIQQVLLNLLTNARQAMDRGGQILIKVSHDAAANTVDLMIRDTGGGIPAEKLPRIFDSYYSTKSGPDATGKGGTGVGLSTCKDIVDAHKGKILVNSSVGKGTAFTIKLPITAEPRTTGPVKLGLPNAAGTSSPNVPGASSPSVCDTNGG
ncbi:MAG: HAMP domain-containing sensor histidine kinase [Pirellulales bacterium]